jgi:HAD superfamily hydrolase (TIGR01450 family)
VSEVDTLVDTYDLFIFDLDGVVVLGHEPVDGAVEAVNALIRGGVRTAYATNNASRSAEDVAGLLVSLGITATATEVVTSAQASARVLAERLAPGSPVLVVGGPALRAEISGVGLTPVTTADDGPKAVVQGYAADVGWVQLAEACVAIRAGAIWVATNADRTLPSPRGELPGNGALIAALATALGRQPDIIVGKPAPALFESAAAKVGARRPLVIGDRLDTDIAGAVSAHMDSMLVLTGVSTPEDLLAAPADQRPTLVARDLRELAGTPAVVPRVAPDATRAATGGWRVRRSGGGLELDGEGSPAAALAALAALCWADAGDVPEITAANGSAARVVRELGLGG